MKSVFSAIAAVMLGYLSVPARAAELVPTGGKTSVGTPIQPVTGAGEAGQVLPSATLKAVIAEPAPLPFAPDSGGPFQAVTKPAPKAGGAVQPPAKPGAGWFGGLHIYGNVHAAIDGQPKYDINKAMKRSGMAADFGRDNRYPDMSDDDGLGGLLEVGVDLVRWLRISGRYHQAPDYNGVGFVDRRVAAGGGYDYITVRETLEARRSGCGIDFLLRKRRFFTTILGLGVDEWRTSVNQSAPDSSGRIAYYRETCLRQLGGMVRTAIEFTPVSWLSFRASVMKSFVKPVPVADFTSCDFAGNPRTLAAHEIDASEIAVTFGVGVHL
jgi:hypothetical protein